MSTPHEREPHTPAQTFPPTSGGASGWLGLTVIAVLLVTTGIHERTLDGVRIALALVAGGLVIYAFMLRPKIEVRGHTLVLVNPLEDIEVPLGLVTLFEVRAATMVYVGKKKYVGVAIGRKVRDMARPQSEAGASGGSMLFGRLGRGEAPAPTPRNQTIDVLDERVRGGIKDAKLFGETDGEVQRKPVWWLIGSIVGVLLALAVSFLL